MSGEGQRMAPARSRRGAFTLIEVLVVVAIIALLVAILLPSLKRARQRARSAVCLSNMKNIGSSMSMYQGAYRGWLPVGPADRLRWRNMDYPNSYVVEDTPGPNSRAYPPSNCGWGGKRAGVPHDIVSPARPEVLKRPLTNFIYRNAGLDAEMPLFECPDDMGFDTKYQDWIDDPAMLGRPMYQVCGNSYWINPWEDAPQVSKKRVRDTSSIVVAQEAIAYYSISRAEKTMNWHGTMAKHNMVFLDFHAANMYIDPLAKNPTTGQKDPSLRYHGPGWFAVNYFEIMDYYRW